MVSCQADRYRILRKSKRPRFQFLGVVDLHDLFKEGKSTNDEVNDLTLA